MTTTTLPIARTDTELRCEQDKRGGYRLNLCGAPAAFAGRGYTGDVKALCKMHASAIMRRSYASPDDVTELTDEKVEAIRARLAEQQAAKRQQQEKRRAEQEKLHASRVEREWGEYPTQYTTTLIVTEDWKPGVVRTIDLAVHPVGLPADGWDSYHVEVKQDADDLPAYIDVRNPNRLTPAGAAEIAEALMAAARFVRDWNLPA